MSYPIGKKQEDIPTFLHPEGIPIDTKPYVTDFGLELPGIKSAYFELFALYNFILENRQHDSPLPTVAQLGKISLNPDTGCWELPLYMDGNDVYPPGSINAGMPRARYGRMGKRGMKGTLAHRIMFTIMRGEIPDGMVLDHLCENKKCCYHRHLDPITQGDNTRRIHHAKRLSKGQELLF